MKTSIALIGFMGTWKSAVGQVLAERLGMDFLELDAMIEQKVGKTISRIFHEDGEVFFRELEMEVTREVCRKQGMVIACGGGIVLNQINIERLKGDYVIICLTASPEVILKRTSYDNNRPLLEVEDKVARIHQLLRKRQPFYKRAADFKVNTTRSSVNRVTENVIRKLKNYEGYH